MSLKVTAQEAELLRLARAVVGPGSYFEVERLLSLAHSPPLTLGPTAMRLLKETLGRGVCLALLRGGGWRQERSKRLWERTALPPLHFTARSIQLLQWMLRAGLTENGVKPMPAGPVGTWADEALLALALELVVGTPCERSFAAAPRVRSSALCWLMQPAALARFEALDGPGPEVELSPASALTFVLEAWQPLLARSWARMEAGKAAITDPAELTRVGRAQDSVLRVLLEAANAAKRRDLVGFLVEAGAQVLQPGLKADDWVRGLSLTAALRERSEARKHAGAFLRALGRLRAWDQEHRAVRFFDEDDYARSQAMVVQWEVLGDRGFRDAERLLAGLENPV